MFRIRALCSVLLLALLFLTGCSSGKEAEAQGEPVVVASSEVAPAEVAASAKVIAMGPHIAPAEAPSPLLAASGAGNQFASADVANMAAPRTTDGRLMPTRLLMPALNLDIPVEEIGWSMRVGENGNLLSQWDEADYAAGWHKNSATPGAGGNVVLSGHNNIMGAVFRELDQLEKGDIATLMVDGKAYDYSVDKILIVPETNATPEQRKLNAAWIASTDSERLTLVSCWPRDNNTHRIIVIAKPVGQ